MPNGEIAQIRKIRHQISAEFGHDVHKLAAYLREVEKELRQSGQFRFEAQSDSPATSKPNLPPDLSPDSQGPQCAQ
uniref:Uncharacterized protein n=1 Tax=Candidatus Kentrum sp. MB TaxID=2138164 RepID=A0A450Y1N9_9GAMM|nr:MAG: hypothetical protein BECKMB1821G_GA0114241_101830 [Candidatus Kentron sp. MB]VFK35453.1 MAG: hypothetical protein BECKMB1821I_GA0114274_11194 [Candidatus Kentron sp. MB]VFK77397.1 MAG: hypothetical protein BECKMB1821H_GA0114242_11334 [Candidatus Kentron sp. MB]